MPAVTGRTYGGVVGDDEARKGLRGLALCAMAEPEHVPAIAIRGSRLRGGRRVEDMSAPECELGELVFQRDVPIGVVLENQGGREVVIEDGGGGIYMSAPAADYACGFHSFFEKAWPSDVGKFSAVYAWDDFVRDVGDGGEKAKGIEFVGSGGHVYEVDVAEAEGTVMDCLDAVLGEGMGELGAGGRTRF